jgi:hypothetical protein
MGGLVFRVVFGEVDSFLIHGLWDSFLFLVFRLLSIMCVRYLMAICERFFD